MIRGERYYTNFYESLFLCFVIFFTITFVLLPISSTPVGAFVHPWAGFLYYYSRLYAVSVVTGVFPSPSRHLPSLLSRVEFSIPTPRRLARIMSLIPGSKLCRLACSDQVILDGGPILYSVPSAREARVVRAAIPYRTSKP